MKDGIICVGVIIQNVYLVKATNFKVVYSIDKSREDKKDSRNTGNVSGMLLYVKIEETITPDCNFVMSGNKISVKTLDLNKEFKVLAAQLDKIAENHFGKVLDDKNTVI